MSGYPASTSIPRVDGLSTDTPVWGITDECVFYVPCFSYQLQLALVAVAKNHIQIASLLSVASNVVNVVGALSKRCDILHDKQFELVSKSLKHGDLSSGQGLNQETTVKRACDTRWCSHYGTLLRLINMFSSVIEVLEIIVEDGSISMQRYEATNLLESIQSFNFVFSLHLMRTILGITNELSQALQRKCDNPILGVPLTTRQPVEFLWISGYPIPHGCVPFIGAESLLFGELYLPCNIYNSNP